MKKGQFRIKNRFAQFIYAVLFVLGITMMFMSAYIFFSNKYDDVTDVIALVLLGISMSACSLPLMLFNHKTYFFIKDGYISACYGWGQRLECDTCDVAFAKASMNMLTVLLKNGKRHVIGGLMNSYSICEAILIELNYDEEKSVDELKQDVEDLKAKRKNRIYATCFTLFLMFSDIVFTVIFTEGRDFGNFSKTDWAIWISMMVLCVTLLVVAFWIADRAGKLILTIDYTAYRLRRQVICTQPILAGNAISVVSNPTCEFRMTFFIFPNDNSIYFSGEIFNKNFELCESYKSPIFESFEDMVRKNDFGYLVEFSEKFGIDYTVTLNL